MAKDYVGLAQDLILEILAEHHAVAHAELEARIAEAYHTSDSRNVDPHHITTALRNLGATGTIVWVNESTRGGHTLATIQPTDTRRRTTKIETAAARKRLLLARYTGWSQGTKRHPQGLVGPAGEAAVRTAIIASGSLQPATPGAGEVATLLGVRLPGPLDSAGYLVPLGGQPRIALIQRPPSGKTAAATVSFRRRLHSLSEVGCTGTYAPPP